MAKVCVIGLGDMGSGLAKNLLAAGFDVSGYDLKPNRMADFLAMGGLEASSTEEAAQGCDAAFVMVMHGGEAETVLFGEAGNGGLVSALPAGAVVIISATIKPGEMRALGERLVGHDLQLVDSPVSGGRPGAQNGTLTMMAAGSESAMGRAQPFMEAVSGTIHRVGDEIGMGQTVKACLQSLIGSIFTGAFEATALAAKAGVSGEVLHKVFSTSAAGCGIVNGSLDNVMNRRFEKTGSHINTMHKDLTIALDLAMELGVPLFTASTAMQMFQAGRTRHPEGDNQSVALITEEIIGTGLKR
ncbi:MAG: NAD(P)-dependent oxidoreductase [Ahrensia sp.]|nr:NAD(P)-dependent oxidoreductase [Ahrensia sp.]